VDTVAGPGEANWLAGQADRALPRRSRRTPCWRSSRLTLRRLTPKFSATRPDLLEQLRKVATMLADDRAAEVDVESTTESVIRSRRLRDRFPSRGSPGHD
jgi:hypothetical protein